MKTSMASILLAIFPMTALADWKFVIGFNMPHTTIQIVNDTDDSRVKAEVAELKMLGSLARTTHWNVPINPSYEGEIPVMGYVCSATPPAQGFVDPPLWATKLPANLALTNDYLEGDLKTSQIKKRVNAIKKYLHDRPGKNLQDTELENWFQAVKTIGIRFEGTTCENAKLLPAKSYVQGNSGGYVQNRTIMYIIRGSREKGYRVDGPLNFNN